MSFCSLHQLFFHLRGEKQLFRDVIGAHHFQFANLRAGHERPGWKADEPYLPRPVVYRIGSCIFFDMIMYKTT